MEYLSQVIRSVIYSQHTQVKSTSFLKNKEKFTMDKQDV
jgi:hypothetical protein